MKERPILFTTPMVQAILAGRKTMTRRIVKPQFDEDDCLELGHYCPTMIDSNGDEFPGPECFGLSNAVFSIKFPYGQPGDRLWVKETWAWRFDKSRIYYRADENLGSLVNRLNDKWVSPRFMPRTASRITLEITAVRVEMLQDISEDDAISEGVEYIPHLPYKKSFYYTWESIYGPGSYDLNPWVWVIEFKRVQP